MEIGLGAMQMDSRDFWTQTPREWDARISGFLELHGQKNGAGESLTGSELDAMIEADERGEIHSYGAQYETEPPPFH